MSAVTVDGGLVQGGLGCPRVEPVKGHGEQVVKKHVLTHMKPASELKAGDRILTTRGSSMIVARIESVESFEDSTRRPCVAVVARNGKHIVAATHFVADETVMVLE